MRYIKQALRWCPEHHMTDCSPLLNGCSLIINQTREFSRLVETVWAFVDNTWYDDDDYDFINMKELINEARLAL